MKSYLTFLTEKVIFSRFAIATANFLHIQRANAAHAIGEELKFAPPLDFRGALYLGTRGSAQVAGLEGVSGHLDVGMKFDALRIRMTHPGPRSLFEILFGFGNSRKLGYRLF